MVLLFMLRLRPGPTEAWRLVFFVLCVSTSLVISTATLQQDRNDIAGALTGNVPSIAAEVRDRLITSLDDPNLSRRSHDLLAALLFGSRDRLGRELREAYGYLGVAHFLALSGLHLGILLVPLAWAISFLPIGKAWRSGSLLAIITCYYILAGMPPSLVRAAALVAVFTVQRLTGRKTNLARSLILAVFVLVLIDEGILRSGGFQLSCSAVLAIALIGLPLLGVIRSHMREGAAKKIIMLFISPLVITVSVSILTLPLLLSFFGRAPLLAPLYNLLMILPVTLILYLGLAYAALPFWPARPLLAACINPISRALSDGPLMISRYTQPAILSGGVCWPLYAAGAIILVRALSPGCRKGIICGVAALALLISSFLVGSRYGGRPFPTGGSPFEEPLEPTRHTLLFSDQVLVIAEEIGRREAEMAVRAIWKRGVGNIGILLICPARLGEWQGIGYIASRIDFDEAICSPYLSGHDGGLVDILRKRRIRTSFVECSDSLAAGAWRIRIIAPPYPPPSGAPLSLDRAHIRFMPVYAPGNL